MRGWRSIATGLVIAVGTLTAAQADPLETTPRIDRDPLHCLALNIYHEARGESDFGKIAVAHVVMNRVKSHRFPNSICKVVMQGGEVGDTMAGYEYFMVEEPTSTSAATTDEQDDWVF